MIFISLKNTYNKAITHHIKWHLGETKDWEHSDVSELQADGDELNFILNKCIENIPMICDENLKVITWYGDNAKFISKNVL